jgi:tRNA G18 (ribose-2'-O)-methylase SpoU
MEQLKRKELKKLLKEKFEHDFEVVVILENIQYARNVAEIFRICDAAAVKQIYLTGISQQPPFGTDLQKVSRKKELRVPWKYMNDLTKTISTLKTQGYQIIALELTDSAQLLNEFTKTNQKRKLAVIVGNEGYGVTRTALKFADESIMIPMYGKGASLNVSVSLAVFLYSLLLS